MFLKSKIVQSLLTYTEIVNILIRSANQTHVNTQFSLPTYTISQPLQTLYRAYNVINSNIIIIKLINPADPQLDLERGAYQGRFRRRSKRSHAEHLNTILNCTKLLSDKDRVHQLPESLQMENWSRVIKLHTYSKPLEETPL